MNLPALVLTAGLGTRLDPITRLVAKPAVPLGDRTLVEYIVAWLAREGVRDVVMNLHHRPASITRIIGDGAHLGVSVRYSWEHPILGSAGGPRHALPLLDAADFLIVNGDTLCDFALAPMLAEHGRSGARVTLAVVRNPAPDRYNGILVHDDGAVMGFVPKGPRAEGTWHLVGVQVASASVFDPLADGVPAETVAGLYRDMIAATPGRLRAFRAPTSFLDVGTPRDYLAAARGRESRGRRAGVIVWPGANVDAAADLDDAIVIGEVRVPAGFRARSAIVAPASIVRDGDVVDVRGDLAVFPFARLD